MKHDYSYVELACMTSEQRVALQRKRTDPTLEVNREDGLVFNANAYYWLQATGITHHILSACS